VNTAPPKTRHLTVGMTLLEVLVVIAIMAIVLGLANLGFQGGGQRQARISGEKLAAQINHATMLATLRGSSTGLALADNSYRFLQRSADPGDKNEWTLADQRGLKKINLLPSAGRLHLTLDSTPLSLTEDIPDTPQLLFSANGEMPDFEVLISGADVDPGYTVSADAERFQAVLTSASVTQ